MPRIRLFHWLVATLTIGLLTISSFFLPTVAQSESQDNQTIPLFEATEDSNFVGSSGWLNMLQEANDGVSIGGQYYNAQFYFFIHNGGFAQITAELNPNRYQGFRLVAGVNDGAPASSAVNVQIRQGDNIVRNYDGVRPGELIEEVYLDMATRDIQRPNNIGIRVDCHNPGNSCYLYFIQADAVPASNYVPPSDLQGERPSTSPLGQDLQQIQQPFPSEHQSDRGDSSQPNSLSVEDALNIINTIHDIFR